MIVNYSERMRYFKKNMTEHLSVFFTNCKVLIFGDDKQNGKEQRKNRPCRYSVLSYGTVNFVPKHGFTTIKFI
ncbi:Uncharacterized protein dnm_046250 [Desulfonema magnum]|uniref:Uncharacterized protein n=1 Tax=Desulfonema magnum TaxID=45655 RepID=A0A975BNR6_9BACT|nr:Uncharacterized protein dnm_046250 [Desulfonema magnum]